MIIGGTCGNVEIPLFSEEQKRRILRGYCMDDRPSSIYWAGGPVRGSLVV